MNNNLNLYFLLLVLLLPITQHAQTILNVGSNLVTGITNFTNLQDAIDYADPNDIIYVYPGNYGNATMTKSLRLIGVGYLNHENYPNVPTAFTQSSFISTLTFDGSGNLSVLQGLDISTLELTGVSNIIVEGCSISVGTFDDAINLLFLRCHIDANGTQGCCGNLHKFNLKQNIGLQFENCILLSTGTSVNMFLGIGNQVGNLTFNRCIINGRVQPSSGINIVVHNSIVLSNASFNPAPLFSNSIFESTSSFFPCSNPDILCNVSLDTLFAGFPADPQYSFDTKYQLGTNSPALNFASDGGDCGVYGGDDPYIPSGTPPIPFIYEFDADHQGTTGGGIDVNIKVKSQD